MTAQPQDHPISLLASSLPGQAEDGQWRIAPEAEAVLEAALLEHHDDPTLPQAIVYLFGLAEVLWKNHGEEAATTLITTIGRVQPRLTVLNEAGQAREQESTAAGESVAKAAARAAALGIIASPSKRAPMLGEAPAEGSVKASLFGDIPRRFR